MADHLNEILGFEPSVVIHSSEHGEIDLSKENLETFEKIEKGDISPAVSKNIEMPPNYRSEYTFENFVVGASNKFANSAAVAVSNQDFDNFTKKEYNPLFIYGPSGVGKTHLLYAIVNKKGR